MPPVEVLEKRNRNSKTHSLGGNKFAWDGTIGSVHYKDAQDTWQNIDNEFLPVAAPWDWEMVKAGYHIRVKEDFTAGQIIEFEVQGETVQFQPMALEWTNDLDQIQPISMPQNVTPVITNPVVDLLPAVGVLSHLGAITWLDAYGGGIDFEWQCQPTRLAKILRIGSLLDLPNPQQYIIDGGNPVLRLNLIFDPPSKQDVAIVVDGQVWNQQSDIQTFKTIEFVKDGEVLWGFMPLRYWDSAEDNEGQSVATLEKRGNKLYISIRVPYSWLQTAVFPVFIDTDVNEQVGASADDATEYGDGYFSTTLTNGMRMADDVSPTDSSWQNSGARFQTVNVPNGATIDVAYQELYIRSTSYDSPPGVKIYANDVDDAVNFSVNANIISEAQRPRTTAFGFWSGSNIGAGWKGSDISLVDVIAEITVKPGWAADQDIVLLYIARNESTSWTLRGDTWDYSGNVSGPKLHIEYTAGGPTQQAVGGGSIAIAATLNRNIFIDVGAGSIAIAGALSSVLTFFQSVGSGSIAIAGSLATELISVIQQAVGGGAVAISGVLGRLTKITVGAGNITISGALTSILTIFQVVGSGAVAIAGALTSVLTIFKTVGGGSITISGTLNRLIKIGVGAGSITIAGALGLKTLISVGAGAITSAATLGRKIALSVGSGSVAMAGSLVAGLVGLFYQAVGGGAVAISGTLGRLIKINVGGGAIAIAGLLRMLGVRIYKFTNIEDAMTFINVADNLKFTDIEDNIIFTEVTE